MSKSVVLAVVLAAAGLAFLFQKKAASSEIAEEPNPSGAAEAGKTVTINGVETSTATPSDTTAAADVSYKDGVYSAIGDYVSPAGPETIDVTLTVTGGIVTDAAVDANAINPASVKWQGAFVSGYKEQIVGKKLSDLSLTNVSGSSLTPKGFNEALVEIRTEARA